MDTMFYYRSDEPMTPYKMYIILAFIILVLLLLVLYRYISSSIDPLKELYVQIERFARGEKDIHIEVEGDDEVAQVANAFHDSVMKNQALERSRSLFLRNVMHELKTPISKGKLLMHFLEGSDKDKALMENLFEQMQGHLNDLARVESMTAKHLELNKHPYATIDVLDHAIDMLELNRDDLETDIHNEIINVDFNLFAYALKNLLDNAMKYADSKPVKIKLENNCLTISNTGKPFSQNFETYLQAYQRDTEQHALEGMGLGLYIANEIVTRHGYTFLYDFSEGQHHFSICF
jgi:two-component system OmpR family sensor kinase